MARYNCILLAAGFSRRYGGNKLLEAYEGKPLWCYPFDLLLALRDRRADVSVCVVSQYEAILETAKKMGAVPVRNPAPQQGISSSMKLGIKAAEQTCDSEGYFLFLVADQPWLTLQEVERLLDGLGATGKRLGALACGGVPGNPVAFGREYGPALLALSGDRGGKRLLLKHLEEALLVETPAQSLRDIDTKDGRE